MLKPDLVHFLASTVFISFILALVHHVFGPPKEGRLDAVGPSRIPNGWVVTVVLVVGYAADFYYQREVPLVAGGYVGFDVSATVQNRVGIPLIHVALIGGAIFYALLSIDRYCTFKKPAYIGQFLVVLGLLLLNDSRGYISFCIIGAVLLVLSNSKRTVLAMRGRGRLLALGIVVGYALLVGIGIFGNIRSGGGWNDTSYIDRLGRYNGSFPAGVSSNLKWIYTYLTSPLANLNYNVGTFTPSGHFLGALLSFEPDTFSKYAVARATDVQYEVSYLNASTGYAIPYYLGGGMTGLYAAYGLQIIIVESGAFIVRKCGFGYSLYAACASVVMITFVFYNSFSNTATCFLIPLAICVSLFRRLRAASDAHSRGPRVDNRYRVSDSSFVGALGGGRE
jgi:hypothetical protein